MKTQISRHSFDAGKRYSGVYQQQGRMITDADWNELSEIAKRRLDATVDDAVTSGTPKAGGAGLEQAGSGQPIDIRAGRLYADGIGADLVAGIDPAATTFALTDQADFPGAPAPPPASWLGYADVWERAVISLEDPEHLRDAALHGADTCTRTQTMAQIKWCPATQDPEDASVNPGRGNAELSLELRSNIEVEDPCDPCAVDVASDGRTGNYLFRLEVHDVEGDPAAPDRLVLKWSGENGAEQHDVGNEPADFPANDWQYEFFDDTTEKHLGVHLATGFSPSRGDLEAGFPAVTAGMRNRVRRWDGFCALTRDGGNNWSFEDGRDRGVTLPQPGNAGNPPHGFVQVTDRLLIHLERVSLELMLEDHTFVAGDYWLAPVREALAGAGDTLLAQAPPVGIEHHYLRLGTVNNSGDLEALDTPRLRQLNFPPLTALEAGDVGYETACSGDGDNGIFDETHDTVEKALDRLCALDAADVAYSPEPGCDALAGTDTVEEALNRLCANATLEYVSGDGQETAGEDFLPGPLQARVAVGHFPVAGRKVEFEIVRDDGNGKLENPANGDSGRTLTVVTNGAGLAQVQWRIDPNELDPPGQRVVATLVDNPAIFLAYNATLRGEGGVDPRIRIEGMTFADGTPLENEMTVPVAQFARGLQILADGNVDPRAFKRAASALTSPGRPNLELSLYIPYPLDDSWGTDRPVGFQPTVLAGEAGADGRSIFWRPLPDTSGWLINNLFQRLLEAQAADRILVFLRLRGNFVWREGAGDAPRVFVDGEAFGRPEDGRVALQFPSGNTTSGGDLEAWFWIAPDEQRPPLGFNVSVVSSTITGTLTRRPGGAISNAKIQLVLGTTGALLTTLTNTQGRFSFTGVPIGTHTLRAVVGNEVVETRVRIGRVIRGPGRGLLIPDNLTFDPREVEDRPVRDVDGVGTAFAGSLKNAGIKKASALAMAEPHKVSEILGVSLIRSRRLIRSARLNVLTGREN